LSASKIGMLGLALAYILSPIDLVPEFLAVIGAVDDFGVLLWLLAALLGESGRYLEWERGRSIGRTGYGTAPGSGFGTGPHHRAGLVPCARRTPGGRVTRAPGPRLRPYVDAESYGGRACVR